MNTSRPATHISPALAFPEGPHPAAQHTGVLLTNLAQRILYASPHAKMLMGRLAEFPGARPRSGPLPSPVMSLCQALQDKLTRTPQRHTWEDNPSQSVVTIHGGVMLLRAIVLPFDDAIMEYRFLVLLEFIPCEFPAIQSLPADKYPSLSKRQQAIVQGLIRGLTNKELASELHISPHTVKEYIRSIMLKVNVTTRSGIVAQLTGLPDAPVASAIYGHQR